jgi:hypothetical protein
MAMPKSYSSFRRTAASHRERSTIGASGRPLVAARFLPNYFLFGNLRRFCGESSALGGKNSPEVSRQ